jgi:hypothetical protein
LEVGRVPFEMPGPDAPPGKVVEALRLRAFNALLYARMVEDHDKAEADRAREAACQLRCQAVVIESMAILYEELGLKARYWAEFAERLNTRYGTRS